MKQQIQRHLPVLYSRTKSLTYRVRRLNPFISHRYLYVFSGRFFDLKQARFVQPRPNLIIIGAEKSGTTSLHNYLDQHPEIFMSKPDKEPQYFLPMELIKKYFDRGGIPIRNRHDVLKNQMLQGYKGEKVFGESTTSYTRGRNAVKRSLAKVLRGSKEPPKLVYIVRHPLKRIESNYLHKRRGGGTDKSMDYEVNDIKAYLYTSLYGYQLAQYLKVFDSNDVMLIYFEDFIKNPAPHLRKICDMVGVDQNFTFSTDTVHNKATNRTKDMDKDSRLSSETYDRLTEKLKSDIKKLEKITGQKAPWKFKKSDWT